MSMITPPLQDGAFAALDGVDPETLEREIHALVGSYQEAGSTMIAWFVVHYAQALCHHSDYEGSDEDRCAWRRLALQWRWLAQAPRCTVQVPG